MKKDKRQPAAPRGEAKAEKAQRLGAETPSRKLVVPVGAGEDILGALRAVCSQQGVRRAVVSGFGPLRALELAGDAATPVPKAPLYDMLMLEGAVEQKAGEYAMQLYVTAVGPGGRMLGGRLHHAVAGEGVKLVLDVLEGSAARLFDARIRPL